jgi:hypothetical protein
MIESSLRQKTIDFQLPCGPDFHRIATIETVSIGKLDRLRGKWPVISLPFSSRSPVA